jgi:hypothetical protein
MKKAEQAPTPEKVAYYRGFNVWIDPTLTPGTVRFLDSKGEIIGTISNVRDVQFGPQRPMPDHS